MGVEGTFGQRLPWNDMIPVLYQKACVAGNLIFFFIPVFVRNDDFILFNPYPAGMQRSDPLFSSSRPQLRPLSALFPIQAFLTASPDRPVTEGRRCA